MGWARDRVLLNIQRCLQEVYTTILNVDTDATVIAAALAPTIETGPQNISDILFLSDMYAAGAKDYMDAVAAKPYGFDRSPIDRTVSSDILNFSRIIALREEMVRNGELAKRHFGQANGVGIVCQQIGKAKIDLGGGIQSRTG